MANSSSFAACEGAVEMSDRRADEKRGEAAEAIGQTGRL